LFNILLELRERLRTKSLQSTGKGNQTEFKEPQLASTLKII